MPIRKKTAPEAVEKADKAVAKETAAPKAAKAPKAPKAPKEPKVPKAVKAPKAAAKRTAAPEVELFVEYRGRQVDARELVRAVQAACSGQAIQSLKLYVKPEDAAVYYVVNDQESGKVDF